MNITCKELYIDGVRVRTPKVDGIKYTTNKMWSANTGRLESSGEMAGTIVATKRKWEIEWPDMPVADYKTIEDLVSNSTAFHAMKIVDAADETHEITVYFGDMSGTVAYSSMVKAVVRDLAVSAIEK